MPPRPALTCDDPAPLPLAPCCPPPGDAALAPDQAERLATVLKALADPVRLRLVSLAATSPAGEVCACDLPDAVDRSQSTVSHHLSQLVAARVLQREQRGRWAWFRVAPGTLETVAAALLPAGSGTSTGR